MTDKSKTKDRTKKWDYEKKAYVPIGTGGQEPWWKNRKKTKIYKASGGRIGLKHGSSAQSHYLQHGYGPTKTRLRTGKPKIAIKGLS